MFGPVDLKTLNFFQLLACLKVHLMAAHRLRHCRSLCILDEFGKGTLTANGIGLLAASLHSFATAQEPPKVGLGSGALSQTLFRVPDGAVRVYMASSACGRQRSAPQRQEDCVHPKEAFAAFLASRHLPSGTRTGQPARCVVTVFA